MFIEHLVQTYKFIVYIKVRKFGAIMSSDILSPMFGYCNYKYIRSLKIVPELTDALYTLNFFCVSFWIAFIAVSSSSLTFSSKICNFINFNPSQWILNLKHLVFIFKSLTWVLFIYFMSQLFQHMEYTYNNWFSILCLLILTFCPFCITFDGLILLPIPLLASFHDCYCW